jgi:hypothetical protein
MTAGDSSERGRGCEAWQSYHSMCLMKSCRTLPPPPPSSCQTRTGSPLVGLRVGVLINTNCHFRDRTLEPVLAALAAQAWPPSDILVGVGGCPAPRSGKGDAGGRGTCARE